MFLGTPKLQGNKPRNRGFFLTKKAPWWDAKGYSSCLLQSRVGGASNRASRSNPCPPILYIAKQSKQKGFHHQPQRHQQVKQLSVPKNRNRRKIAASLHRKVPKRRFCCRNRREFPKTSQKIAKKIAVVFLGAFPRFQKPSVFGTISKARTQGFTPNPEGVWP